MKQLRGQSGWWRSPILATAMGLILIALSSSPAWAQASPAGRTAQVAGIELYYEIVGEGEPLLLLHSGTQTGRIFDPFVERLAAEYRCIIPDLRGHGGSTNPTGEWTTGRLAEDIFGLLDHLQIQRVKAIGASVGAMTLLRMAAQQPDRLEAMVVVGVGTYLPAECRAAVAQADASTLPEPVWERLRQKHRHGDQQIHALYAWVASLAESYGDMAFSPALLSTIKTKTLVVHGDHDYCFPPAMAAEIHSAIPNSYLSIIPNGSHVPFQGAHGELLLGQAQEFLNGSWDSKSATR